MHQIRLKLHNSESRKIEEIVSTHKHALSMYTCGPTIYDFAHIGNFRTYVFEDLLRRTLFFFGYSLTQVMNITDIDDKTIKGALLKGISLKEFTTPYRKAFFEDLDLLNIQRVEHYPDATDYISEMIKLIEILIQKGSAYRSENGSIYFSISHFPTYGRLSHLHLGELKANASGENEADEYDKENISDFVLWKAYDPERDGKIFWESPFGPGRPGWHIECSAMAMNLLGPSVDIHCGGVDNCFPHHENEIAQSESVTSRQFVRHWIHVEHLLVDHRKMSKSLGNFYTLRDLMQKGYSGPEVRYLLLSTHYRTQLNFTLQGLEAARASLERLQALILRLSSIHVKGEKGHLTQILTEAEEEFKLALSDDINISAALAVLFDLVRDLNIYCDAGDVKENDAQEALLLLSRWDEVLGVLPFKQEKAPPELVLLLQEREEARKAKNFALSDSLREKILLSGYLIEDTPAGARLKKTLMSSQDIKYAHTPEQIGSCYQVMRQLRPHLQGEQAFVAQVMHQLTDGYNLVYCQDGEQVKALAGFRFLEFLAWGKVLYIDDLITCKEARKEVMEEDF